MNWVKKSHSRIHIFWIKNPNATVLVSHEQRNLGLRDSHVIKLTANDWKEWISLLSYESPLIAVILIFLFFFQFLLCRFLIFRADTSLFLFNLTFENLIWHIFLIIRIIIRCSGMFWNVLCSGRALYKIVSEPS